MRIAVMGAGSMGSAFGGRLAEAGNEVWLIDVWQEHVERINGDGLRIVGVGGERVISSVKATLDPSQVGPVDLILVFVKSTETRTATQSALPLVGEQTLFLTLQNGLGNRDLIAEIVGEERVLAGVTFDGAALLGPGHVRHTSSKATFVGEIDGEITPRVERLAATFREAGFDMRVTDNLLGEIWGKLLVNAIGNATTAITGYTIGELTKYSCSQEWVRLVGEEAAAVAKALGIRLPYGDVMEKMRKNCADAGPARSSMQQDIEKGRWTEIDFINGAVVREGAKVGLPTPYNQALTLLVKMVEARQHGEERVSPLG